MRPQGPLVRAVPPAPHAPPCALLWPLAHPAPAAICPPAFACQRSESGAADGRSFGKVDAPDGSSTKAVLAPAKTGMDAMLEERGEKIYQTVKTAPLGRSHVVGTQLPAERKTAVFGKPTVMSEDTAKACLVPEKGITDEGAELYRISHQHIPVGTRLTEGKVDWDSTRVDGTKYRFGSGKMQGAAATAGSASRAVASIIDPYKRQGEARAARVVPARVHNFRQFANDEVGRTKYLGSAPPHARPEVFGVPPDMSVKVTAADCLRGDFTTEEQAPDADLGRSSRPGWRNPALDPNRVFGKSSVRPDSRDPTAYEVVMSAASAARGVDHEDFLQSRSQAEVRDIFERIGVSLSDEQFDTVWARAATAHDYNADGVVSVEEFRGALNELMDAGEISLDMH